MGKKLFKVLPNIIHDPGSRLCFYFTMFVFYFCLKPINSRREIAPHLIIFCLFFANNILPSP